MKKILLLILLSAILALGAVVKSPWVREYNVHTIFTDYTATMDLSNTSEHAYYLMAGDTAATSYTGDGFRIDNADVEVIFEVVENSATMNTALTVGVWKSPNYSADGYAWHDLCTLTEDSVFTCNLQDSSWLLPQTPRLKFKIAETGAQQIKYYLDVNAAFDAIR